MTEKGKVLVVTALQVEYQAIRHRLYSLTKEVHPLGTIYERGIFGHWEVVLVQVGPGNVAAAQETERAINYFRPSAALFVGIAGGLKDVSLGDVVAATKVYYYESGADRSVFEPRPDTGLSSYPLVQIARHLALDNKWLDQTKEKSEESPRAFVSPIAAGEKVIKESRGAVGMLLKSNFGDALAVEMEGAGFLRSTYANNLDAMVIRGISDLLDDKAATDSSGSQTIAADHAAAFAFTMLTELFPRYPSQVAEIASVVTNGSTLADDDDMSARLRDVISRLYPLGPRDDEIWNNAGGDLSRLELNGTGYAQWSRAIRLLEHGGGGSKITLSSLLSEMLKTYESNLDLNYLFAKVK